MAIGVIICEHTPSIISLGLKTLLSTEEEIGPCSILNDEQTLFATIKAKDIHVAIFIIASHDDLYCKWIEHLHLNAPRMRILVIAPRATRDMVFKTIRCGAHGFVSAEASPQELREAIFTLRGGHEYFSKSITTLLVNNYVETIRSEGSETIKNIERLSKRELEILTLWGESASNGEIADKLFISVRTVETHKNNIMQKLGIKTTVDLIKFAIRNNIIKL